MVDVKERQSSSPAKANLLARALDVIYRLLATHLAHKAGFTRTQAATGAVTLVQRIAQLAFSA